MKLLCKKFSNGVYRYYYYFKNCRILHGLVNYYYDYNKRIGYKYQDKMKGFWLRSKI